MTIIDQEQYEEIRTLVNEMLGETTAIFMSEKLKGIDIVMPTHKLDGILEKYLPLIINSYNQLLMDKIKFNRCLIEHNDEERGYNMAIDDTLSIIQSKQNYLG